jgi:AcrR family transcriptional regulator
MFAKKIRPGSVSKNKKETKKEKSNRIRTGATRGALIAAARHLFAEKGFADTGTPEIAAAAGVTRGALHHHFIDKIGLFRAVVEREAEIVADQIARDASAPDSALEAMLQGADAYFDAMSDVGRTRLLLLEGPAVLGVAAMEEIDRRTGQRELKQGLEIAIQSAHLGTNASAGRSTGRTEKDVPLDALATVLSAAFDKAAVSIASGEPVEDYKEAIRILASGIPGMGSKSS